MNPAALQRMQRDMAILARHDPMERPTQAGPS
jgi:hypothetical protein